MLDPVDLNNRFTYHAPDRNAIGAHEWVRESCRELADGLNSMIPDSREKSLAITKLEEVTFWANAAIARNH